MEQEKKLISRRTQSYKKLLDKLPEAVRDACENAYLNWRRDPSSLIIKPLGQFSNEAYSAEINSRYRALGYKSKNDKNETVYNWFWVGSHEDYNQEIRKHAVINKIKKMRAQVPNTSAQPLKLSA